MSYRIIVLLSFIIGAEAVLVMVGWIYRIDLFTRILPFGVNMAFPTALMFLISALDLPFLATKQGDKKSELSLLFSTAATILILLIVSTILAAGFFGTQTGMENLFVETQKVSSPEVALLPSVSTAMCFFLFGLANILSLLTFSKSKEVIGYFGYSIIVVSLMAITGYVFGWPLLYFKINESTIPMAFNTALTFVLLGIGLVVLSKNEVNNET